MKIDAAVHGFTTLAQTRRLYVLRMLIEGGASGLPMCETAERLGVPWPTTSFHLSAVEWPNLLRTSRQGRPIIYSARIAGLRELLSFLAKTYCSGRSEIR